MRKLWEDHITWTRLFIVSTAADLPDKQATTERLLRNQQDIGDAIKPFYGRRGGERLSALLTEHILVAADLVAAAKAGDQAAVERHSRIWYRHPRLRQDPPSDPRHGRHAQRRDRGAVPEALLALVEPLGGARPRAARWL